MLPEQMLVLILVVYFSFHVRAIFLLFSPVYKYNVLLTVVITVIMYYSKINRTKQSEQMHAQNRDEKNGGRWCGNTSSLDRVASKFF